MAEVWDPVVEYRVDHTGTQAADAEWISPPYELNPNEAIEIFRIEVIPPIDTTTKTVQKLKYVTIRVDGKEYETIRINSVMAPAETDVTSPAIAVNLGVPILHRPILGYTPSIYEATCPKASKGKKVDVKVVAEDNITQPYSVILKFARVREQSKLIEIAGPTLGPATIVLDNDVYAKPMPPITLDTFDELPGGLAQSKPMILPWVTYARNKIDTTPNQWYSFTYDTRVKYDWMNLGWNLVNKSEAYLVKALSVIPHANSKAIRLNVDGRVTVPEFEATTTRNVFYPPMTYNTDTNATMKKAGPVFLKKPFLFHGVKGGIEVIDNGTAIPANGIEVMVWGTKFILK